MHPQPIFFFNVLSDSLFQTADASAIFRSLWEISEVPVSDLGLGQVPLPKTFFSEAPLAFKIQSDFGSNWI